MGRRAPKRVPHRGATAAAIEQPEIGIAQGTARGLCGRQLTAI